CAISGDALHGAAQVRSAVNAAEAVAEMPVCGMEDAHDSVNCGRSWEGSRGQQRTELVVVTRLVAARDGCQCFERLRTPGCVNQAKVVIGKGDVALHGGAT